MSITRIQFRRGTTAQWVSANPILGSGEMGYEINTRKIKIGDGALAWNDLEYVSGLITGRLVDLNDVAAGPRIDKSTLVYNATTELWEAGPATTTEEIVNGGNF